MLTLDDVSRHWQLTPQTVRARIAAGDLPAVRVAGRYRVRWPDVWACEQGKRPSGVLAERYRTRLLTKADIARAVGVSVRTVERWMREGLPTRAVGGNVRFNGFEAAGWLKSRFGADFGDALAAPGPASPERSMQTVRHLYRNPDRAEAEREPDPE